MVSGCAAEPTQITILATYDIHGGIEPTALADGTIKGGLADFSGTVPGDERYHHRVSQGRAPLSQPKVRKTLDTTKGPRL
jgi:hypothetical protein